MIKLSSVFDTKALVIFLTGGKGLTKAEGCRLETAAESVMYQESRQKESCVNIVCTVELGTGLAPVQFRCGFHHQDRT